MVSEVATRSASPLTSEEIIPLMDPSGISEPQLRSSRRYRDAVKFISSLSMPCCQKVQKSQEIREEISHLSLSKSLLQKNMDKIFQCPVCLKLPQCNIYQCQKSHLTCAECYDKMPKPRLCPTCRVRMPATPMRNLSAEQVRCLFLSVTSLQELQTAACCNRQELESRRDSC